MKWMVSEGMADTTLIAPLLIEVTGMPSALVGTMMLVEFQHNLTHYQHADATIDR